MTGLFLLNSNWNSQYELIYDGILYTMELSGK